MIDFSKKYKLKRQYKLSGEDNCNYIVAHTGERCVFLHPAPAFVINSIIQSNNLMETVNNLGIAFSISQEDAKGCVLKVFEKLLNYLEDDVTGKSRSGFNIENSKDILTKSTEFVCPIVKANNPRKIKFYLTDYCPRFCLYCFAGAKYVGKKKYDCSNFLSVSRFKDIIIEAKEFGVETIEISGGDPFVLKDIFDYLEVMIKYFPHDWGTSTKAYISKEDATKLSEINLTEIQVSLDSFNPEIADKLMGVKGAFYEVIDTIKNLQDAGLAVISKSTITSLNIYDIPELFMNFIAMGIKHLRFSYYYISGNRHGDYLYPNNEQFLWLNQNMQVPLQYAKDHGVTTDFENHPPYDISNNLSNRAICGGFTDTLSIKSDGGALFCDSLNHCDEFVAGNLKNQGLKELWNSDGVKNMNDPFFFYEKYKGTKCYNCNLYRNCFYKRCYLRTFAEYGKYFDIDPACPFGNPDYIIK